MPSTTQRAMPISISRSLAAGEARIANGSLDFYQTNLRLRELRATLSLQDTSLTFDAAGKAGDGTLEIDGRFGWRDRRLIALLRHKRNAAREIGT